MWPNFSHAKSVNLSESQYRLGSVYRSSEAGRSPGACGAVADDVVIVRLRGNRDDCVVPETIRSGRELHAKDAVPMAVVKFLRRQVIA